MKKPRSIREEKRKRYVDWWEEETKIKVKLSVDEDTRERKRRGG